ncbi:MAG TPA: zf-HC2 domain-containing protein [Candidatus Tectomicrobia bacterium]|nr:zf-HC2 domain-containing protein [Candidatus Tectomicrobia bacterium]
MVPAMPDCGSGGASEIECRQIAELLGDYLDGSLSQRLRDLIDFHVDGCPPCVAFMNTYRGTIDAARALRGREVEIPVELKKRLLAVVRSERAPSPRPR